MPTEVRSILDGTERLILLSIEGGGDGVPESTETSFHGFKILGKTEPAGNEQQQLLRELYKGIEQGSSPKSCFEPRHGISATRGSETVDLVICFECAHIEVWGRQESLSLTSAAPADHFNAVLNRAGVPLAKP